MDGPLINKKDCKFARVMLTSFICVYMRVTVKEVFLWLRK
jgi:hypothetical protein